MIRNRPERRAISWRLLLIILLSAHVWVAGKAWASGDAPYAVGPFTRCVYASHVSYGRFHSPQIFGPAVRAVVQLGDAFVGYPKLDSGSLIIFQQDSSAALRQVPSLQMYMRRVLTEPLNWASPYAGGRLNPSAALVRSLVVAVGNVDVLWNYPPAPDRRSKTLVVGCLSRAR